MDTLLSVICIIVLMGFFALVCSGLHILMHEYYNCEDGEGTSGETAGNSGWPDGPMDGATHDGRTSGETAGNGGHLWHDTEESGCELPAIDREVIVITDNGRVCFAHRPDPDGIAGRNVDGKVVHIMPMLYDGWSIPDVRYWLDVEMPG